MLHCGIAGSQDMQQIGRGSKVQAFSDAELEGEEAMARSQQLTKLSGVKKALLWPYVGLIIALRLVSMGRSPIISLLPNHIIKDVPEIPFVIYCSFVFLSVVLSR